MGTPVKLPPFTVEMVFRSLAPGEQVDWGLSLLGVPDLWKSTQGRGIKVAVLDTGCESSHPDLAGAVVDARNFTRHGPRDVQGHGTHVAGTIAARKNDRGVVGVAPECELLIGKVLGDDGNGDSASVARGIEWAVEQGASIISMSLGSAQNSADIAAAVQAAVARGCFVICAAGNEGPGLNTVNYPARLPETIAVAAVDRYGRVADYSSRGPQVDIAAPGSDVLSTWPGGSYSRISGTSMATPFVSGVVALLLAASRGPGSQPISGVDELRKLLAETATDSGPKGRDPHYGFGLIAPGKMLEPKHADEARSNLIGTRQAVTINGQPFDWVLVPRGQEIAFPER